MIIVYTRPDCAMCQATKIYLKRNEVLFEEVDVAVDRGAAARVLEMGYTSVPVVVVGTEHWSGFRIDKLAALKARHG